ncbi:MAG: aminopeptidase [Bdellovibrionota bacterium]
MKFLAPFLLLILFLAAGCSHLGYLTEQGYNFAKIQWFTSRSNEKVLDDPEISEEVKRKILLVQEYKKFFYYYFNSKETDIYTKTSMLDHEAVTYLVIASPHTKIEAHEFDFPFVGSFPYIGFYKKESAKKFSRNLRKKENLVTYVRPVYAYSTLGYFEDRILSSFFEYDDIELAETIFHELFHTVFFIKDEVELNENLANFYGKELLKEYFKDQQQLADYMSREVKKDVLKKRVVELISILQGEFAKLGTFLTDKKADELTQRFVNEVFKPDLRALCTKIGLPNDECEFKHKWNQASFAAFLTYEEEQDFLSSVQTKTRMNLKEILKWLRDEYETFKDQDKIESFTDYLKTKVTDATPVTH